MRIIAATIFCLRIPFVEAFRHSASARACSDSIVMRVTAEDGTVGYGEGVTRPYVTGETVESSVSSIVNELWPAVARADYSQIADRDFLDQRIAKMERMRCWLVPIRPVTPFRAT